MSYIINIMSEFDFDHELTFITDFDANVILQSDVPDKSQPFQDSVQAEVDKIKIVLNLHGGVHKLSTFITENDVKYKVTVERS